MTKRTKGATPADLGFAAARAEATRTPPTRADKIAMGTFLKGHHEQTARGHIDAALKQLHSMLDEIGREAQRPENSLAQVLYHIRHEMAWKYANISSTLDHADDAVREALVAGARVQVLTGDQEGSKRTALR